MAAMECRVSVAVGIGVFLCLAGCSVRPAGHEKGAAEAAEVVAVGQLKLKEYPVLPYPPGHNYYTDLLRERCGVEYEVPKLPPGVADADFKQEVHGWNEVIEAEIKRKFGAGIFGQLQEEAKKTWQESLRPEGTGKAE